MAKRGGGAIAAYNAAIAAIKSRTGVSHREAQQTYRSVKARTGKAPTAETARSKAVREEASKAGKQIAAAKRRQQERIERAIANARKPRERHKTPVQVKPPAAPPKSRGEPLAPPGGLSRERRRQLEREPEPDYEDVEPPEDIGGEEEESPDAA